MLAVKISETFSQDKKVEVEPLDPLLEVSESVANEEVSTPQQSEGFVEFPPRILGVFDVKEELSKDGLKNVIYELGVVDLCWPEPPEARDCFPPSYYTNSEKERLLLAYAENFRRQFIFKRPTHKALLLQAPNECGLQKMVCTTIRPTKLCYRSMDTWQGCASLVSDYLDYEPLARPMLLPERIASPLTCLERRSGNAFELATVLVSYLAGAGYEAYVVSGYAEKDTTCAYYARTVCPFLPPEEDSESEGEEEEEVDEAPRFKLAGLPDLSSRYVRDMEAKAARERQDELDKAEAERLREIAELEKAPPDDMDGWRSHAWVLILPSRDLEEEIFIEPSVGEPFALDHPRYHAVHSVYNQENYYVNMQDCRDLANIVYDLSNLEHWEHLLAGEPPRSQVMPGVDLSDPSTAIDTEKHLDMPASWVERLNISADEFERRYPGGHKVIHYKKVLMEKFAPYSERDGLVKKIKIFDDYDLTLPVLEYNWFANRVDYMLTQKLNYVKQVIREKFKTGREDYLKQHTYAMGSPPGSIEAHRTLRFYYYARLEHLVKIECTPLTLRETYRDREDRLESRYIEYSEGTKAEPKRQLKTITERYGRNPDVPAVKDVRVRTYHAQDNTFDLQYHYAYNFVTMSTRSYVKPNLAETGGRILFNPETTTGYIADPLEKMPRALDLYLTLCDNMALENLTRKHIRDYEADVASYLRARHQELTEPRLVVFLFDTERNEKAKRGWKEQEAQRREVSERETEAAVDPLTPYLARMSGGARARPDQPVSYKAASILREQCLNDFKAKQLARQNLVQERFDKTNEEYKNKRLWYLANQFILSQEKEAAYFEASGRLAFEVHTLEVRLSRHRELSAERARALERTLDTHPILREYNRVHHYGYKS